MARVASSPVTEATVALLRETFEGPSGPSTYFIDNDPNAGFFGTIDRVSADEASRPFGRGGASIAGHAFHAGFHLDVSTAWLRGDREPRDWTQSWTVTSVDEPGWADLRTRLHRQFDAHVGAIESDPPASGEDVATAIAALAHAAYHLGAIRQRVAAASIRA